MTDYLVVRQLDDYPDVAFLVQRGKDYAVIVTYYAEDTARRETLAFKSDAAGAVTDWRDIAGGIGWSLQDALDELNGVRAPRTIEERSAEAVIAAMEAQLNGDTPD